MAQKVLVRLEDDIDGTEATETVAFGLDGTEYEIDLNKEHASSLREAYAPYVASARRVKAAAAAPARGGHRRRNGINADGISTEEVRAWAKQQGYKVQDRGRIPSAIIAEYKARKPAAASPPVPAAAADPFAAAPQAEPEPPADKPAPARRGGRRSAAKPAAETATKTAAAPKARSPRKSKETAASTTS